MPRKNEKELKYLQAGVKYHKIYYTKKAKTEEEGEKKEEKNDFKARSQFAFMSHTSLSNHSSKEGCQ